MTEKELQKQVLQYLKLQYPKAWEMTVHAKNETPSRRWDGAFMGNSKGFPDLFIAVPKGEYHGIMIELKVNNGKLTLEQIKWIENLRQLNFYAEPVIGFEWAKEVIDWYLTLNEKGSKWQRRGD